MMFDVRHNNESNDVTNDVTVGRRPRLRISVGSSPCDALSLSAAPAAAGIAHCETSRTKAFCLLKALAERL